MKRPFRTTSAQAFTLVELMVAVALLSLVIVGISLAFKSTITAVNTANAATDTFSAVQTIQRQIATDLHGLDKDGFLVIRQDWVASPNDPTAQYGASGPYHEGDHVWANLSGAPHQFVALHDNTTLAPVVGGNADWGVSDDHADQLVFLARGDFANASGAITGGNTLTFADHSTADAAVVWYGHAQVTRTDESNNIVPFFPWVLNTEFGTLNERTLTFARRAMLLMPSTANTNYLLNGGGNGLAGYPNAGLYSPVVPYYNSANLSWIGDPTASLNAYIFNSRFSVAWQTPGDLTQWVRANIIASGGRAAGAPNPFEDLTFGFRSRVVAGPQWGANSLALGTVRMQPTMLQGMASFRVEWTCGPQGQLPSAPAHPLYVAGSGSVPWFGIDTTTPTAYALSANNAVYDIVEPKRLIPGLQDLYVAQFSFDRPDLWPKALRITYRVVDPGNYLRGGREVVQVINLP